MLKTKCVITTNSKYVLIDDNCCHCTISALHDTAGRALLLQKPVSCESDETACKCRSCGIHIDGIFAGISPGCPQDISDPQEDGYQRERDK